MSRLFIVATPIGNLGDMTERAKTVLREADMIASEDTRNTMKLCNAYAIKTKLVSYHKFNEKDRASELLAAATKTDIDIALVTDAGTPCVSDPGYHIVRLFRENGIEVIPIPGASAAIAALSVSGLDASTFAFIGFLPRTNKELDILLTNIKKSDIHTFIVYESPKRVLDSLERLAEHFSNDDCFVINDMTKLYERAYYGKTEQVISEIQANEKANRGEYVIIIQKNASVGCVDTEKSNYGEQISLEALICDVMVKHKVTIKEAVKSLISEGYPRNKLYAASLSLKEFVNNF